MVDPLSWVILPILTSWRTNAAVVVYTQAWFPLVGTVAVYESVPMIKADRIALNSTNPEGYHLMKQCNGPLPSCGRHHSVFTR